MSRYIKNKRFFWIVLLAFLEVNELREDVPLKSAERRNRLCTCNEDCMGGSKFINISFGALTVIITIALLVQIYYGDYQVRTRKYVQ